MSQPVAIISMLHEPADAHSANRHFRGEPVLQHTLRNLAKISRIGSAFILCWDDQAPLIAAAIQSSQASRIAPSPGTPGEGRGEGTSTFSIHCSEFLECPRPNPLPEYRARENTWCNLACKGRRQTVPQVDAVAAAGRWMDGWRGGLLQTCDFDLGFHGKWIAELVGNDDVLLIDPAAGLLQPELVNQLLDRAEQRNDLDMFFSQAAPGLNGAIVQNSLLVQLASANQHPGKLLHYLPERPSRDPIAGEACVEVPMELARTTNHFKLNSRRQIEWLENAMNPKGKVELVDLSEWAGAKPQAGTPREVTLEITTRRSTFPAFGPARHFPFNRPDMSPDTAKNLFRELAEIDDLRLTLGGVGDPLCHPAFFEIVESARLAGINAIHIETDLYDLDTAQVAGLVEAGIDIISVNLPAITASTYKKLMGIDAYDVVLQNLKQFIIRRQSLSRGTPIIVPTFVKCRQNFAEMEPWYDQWLRALGTAVITAPSDIAEELSLTDTAPPRRKACTRLDRRMTILSNAQCVSCEQDVLARQVLGAVGSDSVLQIWNHPVAALRSDHAGGKWEKHPVCASCKEWHRS